MSELSLASNIPDAVVLLDTAGIIQNWTGAAARILGWTADEAVGRMIDELLTPRDAMGEGCCIAPRTGLSSMRGVKRAPEREVLVTTKNGELWIGFTSSFQRDPGGTLIGTVISARDITRRRLIDAQKSDVISAVSHELRSPLTSVKGFTATLLSRWDRFDDDMKKQLLQTINDDADRVTRLIGELLDISRIESGKLELRRQKFRLDELAGKLIDKFRGLSERHTLLYEPPAEFPEVFADPDKIEQVVTNILENAIKYTLSGTVEVTLSENDHEISFEVSDEGKGIPEEQRHKVFHKFFRGDRHGNPSGTGLGLYISKGLIEAHKGRLWVDESHSGGALFAFTLPRT
ncbi:MAG TPA: HAMP domain-containing sensor histidine kinase [Actinomycetota bacterium]|nr:HAMP domain-containing sensor histidine kinase [Actinomycetota bacterium]